MIFTKLATYKKTICKKYQINKKLKHPTSDTTSDVTTRQMKRGSIEKYTERIAIGWQN